MKKAGRFLLSAVIMTVTVLAVIFVLRRIPYVKDVVGQVLA